MNVRYPALGIVVVVLVILFVSYYTLQNREFEKEELGSWINFKQNVTKVEDVTINLDYIEKKLQLEAKFFTSGTDIELNTHSKGFINQGQCDYDVVAKDANHNMIRPYALHSDVILSIEQHPDLAYLVLDQTCTFQNELIPNGELTIQINNNTGSLIVDKITFITKFRDSQYGCKDICIFNRQLEMSDFNSEDDIRTIKLEGQGIDTRFQLFSLRTYNKSYENTSNFLFPIIIGLLVFSLNISYDIIKTKFDKGEKLEKNENVVMNDNNEDGKLEKKLAFIGIYSGAGIAIGAAILSVGASLVFAILPVLRDYINKGGTNEDFAFVNALVNSAGYFVFAGLIIIALGVISAYVNIYKRTNKKHEKILETHQMKVLIDAMRDGIEDELKKRGYEAYSVKKLCEDKKMKLFSDYSIIKYAEKHNMVLVTEDIDNVEGCRENKIDCVQFSQDQTLDNLVEELEKIKLDRKNKV